MAKALVVDDNAINRLVASAIIKKVGWEVEEADGGRKGVEMALTGNYKMVLLDIAMPDMNGTEACQAIRERFSADELYIIAYTAHAFPDEIDRILAYGFNDAVIKPINRDNMYETLRKMELSQDEMRFGKSE